MPGTLQDMREFEKSTVFQLPPAAAKIAFWPSSPVLLLSLPTLAGQLDLIVEEVITPSPAFCPATGSLHQSMYQFCRVSVDG